jgi:hypothetical protein
MSLLKRPLLVGLEQKVGELVLAIAYCRKYFKLVNTKKKVVIVTLTTGIVYSLAFTFGCGEFYEGGQRVGPPHVKWPATAESLRNSARQY